GPPISQIFRPAEFRRGALLAADRDERAVGGVGRDAAVHLAVGEISRGRPLLAAVGDDHDLVVAAGDRAFRRIRARRPDEANLRGGAGCSGRAGGARGTGGSGFAGRAGVALRTGIALRPRRAGFRLAATREGY